MAAEEITVHDDREKYCPMLGHQLRFAYCRTPGAEQPCRRLLDCWRETFDVEAFCRAHFTAEQVSGMDGRRPDKMATIVELIAKARRARRK